MTLSVILIGRDLDFYGPDDSVWSFSTYATRAISDEDLVISVNYRSEHMVEAYVSNGKTFGKAVDLGSITGFISTTKITPHNNTFNRKEIISELTTWATDIGAVIPDQDKCLSLMEFVFHKTLLETFRRVCQKVSRNGLSSSKILDECCRLNKLPRITKQMRKKFELSLFEYDDETLGLNDLDHTNGSWKLSMGSAFFKDDGPYVIVTFGRTGSSKVFSKEYPALSRPGNEPIIDPLTVHADLASSVMSIKAPIPSFQVVARLLTNAHMEALREYIRNTCRDAVKSGLSTQECIDAASSILCEEIMIS